MRQLVALASAWDTGIRPESQEVESVSVALDHPMIGPYTVDDWLALPPSVDGSRVELLLGHLYVNPAPSGRHQYAASRLIRPLEDALAAAGRSDLYVVPAVNVRISTPWRTALIPDLVILDRAPVDVSFEARHLALAVEIWSPGNTRAERDTKLAAYAGAGVPYVWTIDQGDELRGMALTAYRLQDGQYTAEVTARPGETVTITTAPVPVALDLADLGV